MHQGRLEPDVPFLQKPFTPLALAQKLRESATGHLRNDEAKQHIARIAVRPFRARRKNWGARLLKQRQNFSVLNLLLFGPARACDPVNRRPVAFGPAESLLGDHRRETSRPTGQ